jgi:site-specific DNA-cytosine methylase
VWITDEALVGDEWCVDCHDRVDIHDEGGFCAGLCGGNCQSPEFGRPGVWNTDDGLPPEGWVPEPGARYFHPMTYGRRGIHPGDEPAPTIRGVQRGMPETYEPHPNDAVVFQGHQKPDSKRTSGEPDAYQTRGAALPAPSITSGSRSAQWLGRFNDQSGTDFDPEWPDKRPALTVATRDIVPNPRHNKSRHDEATKSRNDGVRVTVREAARLQTYPDTFDWSPMVSVLRSGVDTGKLAPMSKTKAFLQIGNAVPPLLALRTLSVILDDMALTPERLERKATP